MKKTKRSLAALCALLLLLSLAACGAKSASKGSLNDVSGATAEKSSVQNAVSGEKGGGTATSGSDPTASPGQETLPSADKIIYSASVTIETRKFDDALTGLTKLVTDSGGFVENSSVSGASYDDTGAQRGYRTAQYTVRIPAEKFSTVSDSLKALGNVTQTNTQAENITMQYTDTTSHLDALKTQEARLMELLAKAQSMDDILKIEDQLANVRYQIESLTSQLKNWDNDVSYSTLNVSLNEVAYYSKGNSNGAGYGRQLGEAFTNSLNGIGRFFKAFFKFLVGALPVLAIIAGAAWLIVWVRRRIKRKKAAKAAAEKDEHEKS